MNVVPKNISDAKKMGSIMFDKYHNEKDPEKKLKAAEDLLTSPLTLPMRVMIISTLGAVGVGWLTKKYVAKKVTEKQIQRIEKITKELVRSHTPLQSKLYEEIKKIESEVGSISKRTRVETIISILSNSTVSRLSKFVTDDLRNTKMKAKNKFLVILTRKYEDSLNNYQLSVYKTLFESQMDVMYKTRATRYIVQIGLPLIALGIASAATHSKSRSKAADNYLKNNK